MCRSPTSPPSPSAAPPIALLFVVSSPRRLARFTAFTNVAEEKDHLAYQIYQGYLSIASGGLTGSGIGGGKGKLGYLPYAQSDFIFAVIADELGLVGTTAVIGGFLMLVAFGIQTALAAPDRFGMLLAGGIATWFGVQAIVNLGGVVGRLPVTGLDTAVLLRRREFVVRQHDRRRSAAVGRPTSRPIVTTATEGPGCFAVVTGGGTAGHVLPAIAVAEALVAAGHDPSTIRYVGSAARDRDGGCSPTRRSRTRSSTSSASNGDSIGGTSGSSRR